jgi:hypothetical protein
VRHFNGSKEALVGCGHSGHQMLIWDFLGKTIDLVIELSHLNPTSEHISLFFTLINDGLESILQGLLLWRIDT